MTSDQTSVATYARAHEDIASFDPGLGAYQLADLGQAIRFADVMSRAGEFLPEHLRRKPALCLAVVTRAVHWGFDPFALAQETYQAKAGGVIGYQAKVFSAVLRKNGVALRYRYEGTVTMQDTPARSARGNQVAPRTATGDRRCTAFLVEDGEELAYTTPTLDAISVKNSPLWHHDPDQQLAYYAVRGWARRYRADLMMGAYAEEEVGEMPGLRDVTPQTGFARLAGQARGETPESPETGAETGAEIGPETEGPETAPRETQGSETGAETGTETGTPATPEARSETTPEGPEPSETNAAGSAAAIDRDSWSYRMGVDAGREGFPAREDCPFQDAEGRANWLAGYAEAAG